jgi:hypothetical protein
MIRKRQLQKGNRNVCMCVRNHRDTSPRAWRVPTARAGSHIRLRHPHFRAEETEAQSSIVCLRAEVEEAA